MDTEFGVGYQFAGTATSATVRFTGQVDAAHGSSPIEVWVNGTHYHVAAGNAAQNADSTANAVVAALKANDWPALYDLADDSLRNGMTAAQFAQQVTSAFGAGTKITDVTITGAITYTTNQAGVSYADVPITMTVFVNGANQTTAGVLVLIDDQGSWRWFTTKPAS